MRSQVKTLGRRGGGYWNPDSPSKIDYRTYHASCDAVARGLVERGLKPCDRVGILCSNRVEFLEIFYGSMRAGIVPVPIGAQLPKSTLEWILGNSEVKAVFCDSSQREGVPGDVAVIDVDSREPDGYAAFKRSGSFEPFKPVHDSVAFQSAFPLERAAEALRLLEDRGAFGKAIVNT